MKRTDLLAALVLVVGLAVPSPAIGSQGRGHAKHSAKQHKALKKEDKQAAKSARKHNRDGWVFDRDRHVRAIRDYRRSGSLPPGLARHESLPPGLRRQLRERGQLPPGLQKRLVGVPGTLESRFPPMPPYYHRYFAGDDLIVVDGRTNTIAAIVREVLR